MITSEQIPKLLLGMMALGLITFCYRYSFISSAGRRIGEKIPTKLLALLGPAVFTAIITNNILSYQNQPQEFQNKIVAATASLMVAYFTRNVVVTLVFGLIFLNWISA